MFNEFNEINKELKELLPSNIINEINLNDNYVFLSNKERESENFEVKDFNYFLFYNYYYI
jgi:hypothetical protein